MKAKFIQFLRDEEGATAIEYALVAAMVALVLVTFITDIQGAVEKIFTAIKDALVVPAKS